VEAGTRLPLEQPLQQRRQPRPRGAQQHQRDAGLQEADPVGKGANNVYGDRNDSVQRQNSKGNWQSRENGRWKNSSGNRSWDLGRDSRARQVATEGGAAAGAKET
jgi:hypothetical protein